MSSIHYASTMTMNAVDITQLLPVLASFALCAATLWLLRKWKRSAHGRQLPPSPPGVPILGHLHLLGELPHQSLYELSKRCGPLMYLRLGEVPTIVASSPDMARQILKTHDHVFASRPRTAAGVHTLFNCTDVAWAPSGPYWRRVRQICVLDLFSPKRMEAFRALRTEEKAAMVRSVWEAATGGVNSDSLGGEVQVRSKVMSMTNNIICRMTFGKRFSALAANVPSCHDLPELIAEIMMLNGVFNIGDFLPWLDWLDLQGHVRHMKAAAKRSAAVLQAIFDKRRAEYAVSSPDNDASRQPKDLLDVLLSIDASSESNITDDNVKAVLWDMFGGGTDTSAVTAEWGLAELLKKPSEMKKLQAELDTVVGKERLMEEADLPKLPFLQAVVKETMRLHPAAPLLIPHESVEACEITAPGGDSSFYYIAPKTRVLVNVWAVGRDEEAWERPLDFSPDRFLTPGMQNVDVKGQHFELLPFGSGRRGCPGYVLGLLSVQVMLGVLVHAFDWSVTDDRDRLDMSETFGLTVCRARPLVAVAKPRLPSSLYQSLPL